MKVQQSLQRLGKILPIKNVLDSLDESRASIYFSVLNGFYQLGRAPLLEELEQVDSLARKHVTYLAEKDMLTLDDSGEVKGCYPFTQQKRGHRIQLNGSEVYAMCALDALAPSSMFQCSSTVMSKCAVSGNTVQIELENQTVKNADEVAELNVGINWMAASSCGSCSDSLCSEMLFLKDTAIAQSWLEEDPENRDIYSLDQAIEFAADFFKPMLQQS